MGQKGFFGHNAEYRLAHPLSGIGANLMG
jgi:hypothetical protein